MALATAEKRKHRDRRKYHSQTQREDSQLQRDIAGKLGEVQNWPRRRACKKDFRRFCDCYFAARFDLVWSKDHLTVIKQIEAAVLRGELFATAMPRGSGKTTLCATACIWAILYGHHRFVALLGSDEGHAALLLEGIKTDLESAPELAEDFPLAVGPLRLLEGISHRARGQIHGTERTRVEWSAGRLVMPTLRGSEASGAVIRTAGLTGGFRGLIHTCPDGQIIRPSLVLIDDPQTDESASSPSQCEMRERILAGAVLGLAGPGKKIAGLLPCTVLRRGDLADRILDREKHPDWHGTRTKLVYSFPPSRLWGEYANLRAESLRLGKGGKEATEFYRANRAEMDEGAAVAWEARFNPGELSAIQHAMNLKLRDERAFWAEYQNEPLPSGLTAETAAELTPEDIASKLNGHDRGLVPLECRRLTAMIDVQATLLYYVVVAWADDFSGAVIDYGAFPDQLRPYWTLYDAAPTLANVVKASGLEGLIFGGLGKLTAAILGRDWIRDDGAPLRVERCLIDANWGRSTDTVYQFCRQSPYSGILMPSHGRFIGASSIPMRDYGRKPGDHVGLNWRLPSIIGKRTIRYLIYDSNWWKSFLTSRLATAAGDRGSLALWGDDPRPHRILGDHCTAEFKVRTSGRGREVDEWRIRPERPDNHLFDCLVGAAVAASMQGVNLGAAELVREASGRGKAEGEAPSSPRPRPSFEDLWKNRRRISPGNLRSPRRPGDPGKEH